MGRRHPERSFAFVVMFAFFAAVIVTQPACDKIVESKSEKQADDKKKKKKKKEKKLEPLKVELSKVEYDASGGYLTVVVDVKTVGVSQVYMDQFEVQPAGGGSKTTLKSRRGLVSVSNGQASIGFQKQMLKPGKYEGTMRLTGAKGDDRTAELKVAFVASNLVPAYRDEKTLKCVTGTCEVKLADGSLEVKAADGTKVEVTGSTTTISGGKATVPVDAWNALGKQNPKSLAAAEISFTLIFPDGENATGSVPYSKYEVEQAISKKLLTVTKGGISLPGDDKAPAKARIVATMTQIGHGLKFYGEGSDLKSIDLVAINNVTRQTGSCGTYRNTSTGATETVSKITDNSEVTIYERRTGKVKARKMLRADPPKCPASLKSGSSAVSSVPDEDIKAFIMSNM